MNKSVNVLGQFTDPSWFSVIQWSGSSGEKTGGCWEEESGARTELVSRAQCFPPHWYGLARAAARYGLACETCSSAGDGSEDFSPPAVPDLLLLKMKKKEMAHYKAIN